MNNACRTALVIVGLINAIPIIGVMSADVLSSLYGMSLLDGDLLILMRHRAVLLGIVGAFLIASAFNPRIRLAAIIAGFVSMGSFILLVSIAPEHGQKLHKVMMIDVIAIVALTVVVFIQKQTQEQT